LRAPVGSGNLSSRDVFFRTRRFVVIVIDERNFEQFERAAFERFLSDMRAHIERCFPEQFLALERETLDELLRHGLARARAHGFSGERDVCKFIDLMLVFGRGFDRDPQFPWASEILVGRWPIDPSARIDRLGEEALAALRRLERAP
jgi:hypothetical protein